MSKSVGGTAAVIWSAGMPSQIDNEKVRMAVGAQIKGVLPNYLEIEVDGIRVRVTLDLDDVSVEGP